MRAKSSSAKKPAEQVVKDIRRATRRHFSAEDKIRIVLDGLRGDDSIMASLNRPRFIDAGIIMLINMAKRLVPNRPIGPPIRRENHSK